MIQTDRIGNVFLIGINRPVKRNSVNRDTADALVKAFHKFEHDNDLHAAVLYGKGIFILYICLIKISMVY